MDSSPTWTIARGPHSEVSFQPPPPAIPASCRASCVHCPPRLLCADVTRNPGVPSSGATAFPLGSGSLPGRRQVRVWGGDSGQMLPPVSTPCTEDAAFPPGPGPSYHPGQKLKLCLQLPFPQVPAHWVDHGWWELKGCLFGVLSHCFAGICSGFRPPMPPTQSPTRVVL